jgi:hypothetical protein
MKSRYLLTNENVIEVQEPRTTAKGKGVQTRKGVIRRVPRAKEMTRCRPANGRMSSN